MTEQPAAPVPREESLMPRTKAGRALLDELAGRAMDFGTVLDHAAWAEAIDAIEEQAAQQERERIRNKVGGYRPVKPGWAYWREVILQYILAEPSDD